MRLLSFRLRLTGRFISFASHDFGTDGQVQRVSEQFRLTTLHMACYTTHVPIHTLDMDANNKLPTTHVKSEVQQFYARIMKFYDFRRLKQFVKCLANGADSTDLLVLPAGTQRGDLLITRQRL